MRLQSLLVIMIAQLVMASGALSQEAARNEEGRPAGVSIGQTESGAVFIDARGMTLYSLNARLAGSRSGASLKYCVGPCTSVWSPLVAPADAQAVAPWTVVDGALGRQWAYKGNPVFTYLQDRAPGSRAGDGYDDLWTAIAYVPPPPQIVAPASVTVLFVDGAYIMADRKGRALFTSDCAAGCEQPLVGGMASLPIGDWKVARSGDRPQWTYRGKPVYVSQNERKTRVPQGAVVLRP